MTVIEANSRRECDEAKRENQRPAGPGILLIK